MNLKMKFAKNFTISPTKLNICWFIESLVVAWNFVESEMIISVILFSSDYDLINFDV